MIIQKDQLQHLLDSQFSVPCIAQLLGVSPITIFRRMAEYGLSVRGFYSTMTDAELDNMVRAIKTQMPNAGYRSVKGQLMAMGSRVQWERITDSMHRLDAAGILSRLARLGCTVRRSYSVRGPLALVHIDTNHKLIRYNLVIFDGVDGFSRKVLYLDAATNNRANTALFFLEATRLHGVPSRVRGDQGVENVDIAHFMFERRGTGRASFISGKSVHNQRIERMWRDVWMAVTCIFYDVLHTLEEDGVLDIANIMHLFCVHYVFLPHLRSALQVFVAGWNHHPLRTERNHTPEQLWQMGHLNTPQDSENLEDLQNRELYREGSLMTPEATVGGVQVPEFQPPLPAEDLAVLQSAINPLIDSDSNGYDLYIQVLEFVTHASTPH
ncbi:unnamed protein product [Boreogadus saida]